jgi:hypothetical protein
MCGYSAARRASTILVSAEGVTARRALTAVVRDVVVLLIV